MDCEVPQRYVDYEQFQQCQSAYSEELRLQLVEHCKSADAKLALDQIEVSGVTYTIFAKCADLTSSERLPKTVGEVDE